LEYLVLSANSSNTTSNLFPLELTACTAASKPNNRKEINHLIVVDVMSRPITRYSTAVRNLKLQETYATPISASGVDAEI
jgi:hypothetical protein